MKGNPFPFLDKMLIIVCRTIIIILVLYAGMASIQAHLLKIIADNVRRERRRQGLSQEELADMAQVHRTYIGMIERAEKNLTVLSLEKVAKALNVAVAGLLETKERM